MNPEIDPTVRDPYKQPFIRYNLAVVCHSDRVGRIKETRGRFTYALGEGQGKSIFKFYVSIFKE